MGPAPDRVERCVARLSPVAPLTVDLLLDLPLGLDVWERDVHSLVVAATNQQLADIEHRHLATVERLRTEGHIVPGGGE